MVVVRQTQETLQTQPFNASLMQLPFRSAPLYCVDVFAVGRSHGSWLVVVNVLSYAQCSGFDELCCRLFLVFTAEPSKTLNYQP